MMKRTSAPWVWLLNIFSFFSMNLMALPPLEAQNNPRVTLKIFSAAWCEPCRELHNAMHRARIDRRFSVHVENQTITVAVEFLDCSEPDSPHNALKRRAGLPEIQFWTQGAFRYVLPSIESIPELVSSRFAAGIRQTLRREREVLRSPPRAARMAVPQTNTPAITARTGVAAPTPAIIIGTGSVPRDNPIFVPIVIRSVQATLNRVQASAQNNDHQITLYGETNPYDPVVNTPEFQAIARQNSFESFLTESTEVSEESDGNGGRAIRRTHRPLVRTDSFTQSSLTTALQRFNQTPDNHPNQLLVVVGHGSRSGISQWRSLDYVTPASVNEVLDSRRRNIMVSGACFSGAFAAMQNLSCGFFAAPPNLPAYGCSADPNDVERGGDLKDYVSSFFRAVSDNAATFEEAHHRAIRSVPATDHPYTSIDFLADRFFQDNERALPESISMADATRLLEFATPLERETLMRYLTQLQSDVPEVTALFLKRVQRRFRLGDYQGRLNIDLFSIDARLPFQVVELDRRSLVEARNALANSYPGVGQRPQIDIRRSYLEFRLPIVDRILSASTTGQAGELTESNRNERVTNISPLALSSYYRRSVAGQVEWMTSEAYFSENSSDLNIERSFGHVAMLARCRNSLEHCLIKPSMNRLLRRVHFRKLMARNPQSPLAAQLRTLTACEQTNIRSFLSP